MENFRKLGISEDILKAIEGHKFDKPTEIQEKTIPLVLEGKDIIAGSATGSGKTLAFGCGMLHNVKKKHGIQGLILTPTRELAEQVKKALKSFSNSKKAEILAIYGGVSINPQIKRLQTAEIVVGTPGRLLDHIERRTIELDNVKTLVLDEADRMLDMGFIDDVDRIVRKCPKDRQTLLFSATISNDISRLAKRYMKDFTKISATSFVDPRKLKQVYYDIQNSKSKFSLLVHLLREEKKGLVMVFCNTRNNTDFVGKNLKSAGLDAMAIHGGFSQDKRTKIMKKFNSESAHVLVCTDVAARGLDIKGISHVYNYDLPKESKEYVHRIGRTARAGKEGKVINLLTKYDHDNFRRVLKDNDLTISEERIPQFDIIKTQAYERRSDRGRGGNFWNKGKGNSRGGQGRRPRRR